MWTTKPIAAATLILGIVCASRAQAGNISLDITPRSGFSGGRIHADIAVHNVGGEPALAVQTEVWLGERHVAGERHDRLPAGGSLTNRVDVGAPPQPPGIHTLVVRVLYEDETGHPFSALATIPVFTADTMPLALIEARLTSVDLDRSERATLTLVSRHTEDVALDCRLVLPRELRAKPDRVRLTLSPGRLRRLPFTIENRTAIRGSYYRIFAIVDMSHAGAHQSLVVPAAVAVTPFPTLSQQSERLGVIAAILLLVLFGAAQCVKAERSARTPRRRIRNGACCACCVDYLS